MATKSYNSWLSQNLVYNRSITNYPSKQYIVKTEFDITKYDCMFSLSTKYIPL